MNYKKYIFLLLAIAISENCMGTKEETNFFKDNISSSYNLLRVGKIVEIINAKPDNKIVILETPGTWLLRRNPKSHIESSLHAFKSYLIDQNYNPEEIQKRSFEMCNTLIKNSLYMYILKSGKIIETKYFAHYIKNKNALFLFYYKPNGTKCCEMRDLTSCDKAKQIENEKLLNELKKCKKSNLRISDNLKYIAIKNEINYHTMSMQYGLPRYKGKTKFTLFDIHTGESYTTKEFPCQINHFDIVKENNAYVLQVVIQGIIGSEIRSIKLQFNPQHNFMKKLHATTKKENKLTDCIVRTKIKK